MIRGYKQFQSLLSFDYVRELKVVYMYDQLLILRRTEGFTIL